MLAHITRKKSHEPVADLIAVQQPDTFPLACLASFTQLIDGITMLRGYTVMQGERKMFSRYCKSSHYSATEKFRI